MVNKSLDRMTDYDSSYIAYLSLLLRLYLISNRFELDFQCNDVDSFKNIFTNPINMHRMCFRGVQNKEYDLVPSLYRSIQHRCHIDKGFIDLRYNEKGFTDKYKAVFSKPVATSAFYSYMQHYAGFSPYIDFTENIAIASSFATWQNNEPGTDGAIYYLLNHSHDQCNDEYNIEFFPNKVTLDDKIFGKNLWDLELKDFEVLYRIVKDKTNDRMKYQRGLFVDIHKCVFINNRLCFPFSDFNYFKVCFPKEKKTIIYQDIQKNFPQYLYDNLMSPEKYFNPK